MGEVTQEVQHGWKKGIRREVCQKIRSAKETEYYDKENVGATEAILFIFIYLFMYVRE